MKKREEFGKKFIYFILILWLSTEILFNTAIENFFGWKRGELNDVMAYVILIMLLVQMVFFQSYKVSEMVIISLITAFVAFATINSNHHTMMSTWIFIVAAKHIDFDRMVGIAYFVQLIMIAIVFYMFINGYIKEDLIYRGSILRHSLGFSHPNQLGIRIFLLLVSRCYYRKNKLNFIDVGVVIVAAIFVNKVANSKTSYYALIMLAVISSIYVLLRILHNDMKILANVAIAVGIIANIGSVILSTIELNKHQILNSLNIFMSKRFSQCHRTMKYYGVELFGQDVQLIVKRPIVGVVYHFWLDNAYMSILLRYGVVVFLIFSMLYFATMLYLKRTSKVYLLMIMALYSIYGIMENNFFSMSQNLFLLTLSFPLYVHATNNDRENILSRIRVTW